MGWARKNEIARIYRERRKNGEYVLAMENDHGNFRGHVMLVKRLDHSKWTVERKGNDKAHVHIQYDGVTQQVMGDWTTLCLDGGTLSPRDATDQQVLRAYLGDENIYTGQARYPNVENPDAYFLVEGMTPDAYGGNYQRVALEECPEEFQQIVSNVLRERFRMKIEEARGLYRMSSTVRCKLCGGRCADHEAHRHDGGHVCDGCWDDRLYATV